MNIPEIDNSEEIEDLEEVSELEEADEAEMPEVMLSSSELIGLTFRMYKLINNDYGNFNEETAFIACTLASNSHFRDEVDFKELFLLSANFILGALKFKGEKYSRVEKFYEEDTEKFFNYNYAYLKNMTTLGEKARAFMFSRGKYDPSLAIRVPEMKLAALIFDASRIDIMLRKTVFSYSRSHIEELKWHLFCPELAEVFYSLDREGDISDRLRNLEYKNDLREWISELDLSKEEINSFFKSLIYAFDFKSTQTLNHTINTACYAVQLGKLAGCDHQEQGELFTAGILHDVGKMAIPGSVLESPSALSDSDFSLMKIHVDYAQKILKGYVPQNIYDIAVRHHEKLDGSGYPYGLKAPDLTREQRILTVSDIFSALVDSRSYKNGFSEEKVRSIYGDMIAKNQLDPDLVSLIFKDYEGFKTDSMGMKKFLSAPLGMVQMQFDEMQDFETLEEI